MTDDNLRVVEQLEVMAGKYEKSIAQVALVRQPHFVT
jgi:hypothetical protein